MKTPCLSWMLCACAVFFVGVGSCLAIDCYTCAVSDCGDPFDPAGKTVTTCPSGEICTAQMISLNGTELFSRDCTEADSCTPGCFTAPGSGEVCSYCCDEDRCNSRSVADAVADILHCYSCVYSSDPSVANFSSQACNDPFDPNGAGVVQSPCLDGECSVLTTNYMGVTTVTRLCVSNSSFPEGCTPGCDPLSINCQTCCSDNLCNGGPEAPPTTERSAAPQTTERSAAPPTTAGGKAFLAAILLVSARLLVHLR